MKFNLQAKLLTMTGIIGLALTSNAQTLENVIVEEYATQGNFTTYRVFLDMGEGDKLLAVYGYDDEDPLTGNPLSFSTTTNFYQDAFGADLGEQILIGLFPSFPSAARDSWVSVGGAGSVGTATYAAIPKDQDVDGSTLVDFVSPDGYVDATTSATNSVGLTLPGTDAVNEIGTPDGAYFIAGGASGVGPENVICIGQFTTTGDFSFEINVQLQNGDDEILYLHTNAEQPDGTVGVVDDRLKFSSAFVCEAPFPAVDEASLSTVVNATNVQLFWDPVPNQIGCQVRVREAGGAVVGTTIVGGANASQLNINSSIILNVLGLCSDFEWQVRCGCSQEPIVAGPFSSWQPFTTPGCSSISVSPNPSEGVSFVTFSVDADIYATLEVIDMSGRVVGNVFNGMAQANNEYRFEFDGSSLPNGVYIYRLTTNEEVTTEKFMIAR